MRMQIDYFAIFNIIKQNFIIFTTSTMRINIKLIKTFQFLRQFDLDIKYKLKKKHIMLNVLSKLININIDVSISKNHFELDALFTITLMQINFNFYNKYVQKY